ARKLVEKAAEAGADYIKFQTFITELSISENAKKADYQLINTKDISETQFEMIKKLELSFEEFRELSEYCNKCGIGFLSTGFDIPSIDFLDTLGLPFFKIPSGEINNKPYLEHISGKRKPVIMSTGMADMADIENALRILFNGGLTRDQVTVLHCTTEYPAPVSEVNLAALRTIQEEFKVKVGYSDHTEGIEIAIAAAALGAAVIEKHFTLDRNMEGPDHLASIEPGELHEMVRAIRNVEQALGDGIKKPSDSEKKNIAIARKSIHYIRDMEAGQKLEASDLIMKRPGDGISPMETGKVAGRILGRSVLADTKVEWEDLQ
ncbi:MAG: N-acetylneuraminate synthase, partial [Bacteroidia bacterium]